MKEELIKIAEYFESLEQQIAALRVQVEDLQKVLAQKDETLNNLSVQMQTMLQRMEEFEAREPEVEVELMVDDNDDEELQPEVENSSESEIEAETAITQEPAINPEPEVQTDVEPEVQADVETEVQADVKEESMPKAEAEHQMPIQTSLFGAPVVDIRHAISLGDRFLFQRELFDNNGEQMQKVLNEIDRFTSFDEAIHYIEQFGWDKTNRTYELFVNVLHRRFN